MSASSSHISQYSGVVYVEGSVEMYGCQNDSLLGGGGGGGERERAMSGQSLFNLRCRLHERQDWPDEHVQLSHLSCISIRRRRDSRTFGMRLSICGGIGDDRCERSCVIPAEGGQAAPRRTLSLPAKCWRGDCLTFSVVSMQLGLKRPQGENGAQACLLAPPVDRSNQYLSEMHRSFSPSCTGSTARTPLPIPGKCAISSCAKGRRRRR